MINNHLTIDKLDNNHQAQHKILFNFSQGVIDKVFTEVPKVDQIPVGYMAHYTNGSTKRLYFNIGGTLRYIDFDG